LLESKNLKLAYIDMFNKYRYVLFNYIRDKVVLENYRITFFKAFRLKQSTQKYQIYASLFLFIQLNNNEEKDKTSSITLTIEPKYFPIFSE
jgi:hypothetical protein